jgi:hypothetical protein
MGMGYNRSKFIFSETFNNSSGKTSGSGFIGVITGIAAVTGIAAGTVGYFLEIPNTLEYLGIILKVLGAATILLGIRKLSGDFNSKNIADADATIADTVIRTNEADINSEQIVDMSKKG